MVQLPPALAVIDGILCLFNRQGTRVRECCPLATAVVEFRHNPWRVLVRELPYGLLPGLPNLYSLDGDLRLLWMAEWPEEIGPCARILDDQGEILVAESTQGITVRLDATSGRLLAVEVPLETAV